MKVSGNGQALVLSPVELQLLFAHGFTIPRDRALFGICLFTACRISEALALMVNDVRGNVITFRKSTTKGKLKTRSIDIHPGLVLLFNSYHTPRTGFLFPGKLTGKHLTRFMADKILRSACERVQLYGVSTHSFRRTALTQMSNAGTPLRVIQEISGHNNLDALQRYLEVSPEQRREAVAKIGFGDHQ